jgi:hypothetical protein
VRHCWDSDQPRRLRLFWGDEEKECLVKRPRLESNESREQGRTLALLMRRMQARTSRQSAGTLTRGGFNISTAFKLVSLLTVGRE